VDDVAREPVAWPNAEAVPVTAADGTPKTVELDGKPLEVFTVPVLGVQGEYAKVRDTSVARFVDPNDASVVGYAVLRTAVPVESPTWHPDNFGAVLERAGFDRSLSNTLLVTLGVVFGQLFTSILGGYAFARIRFPGRDLIFLVYLGSIMVPFVVLIIPLYQFMVAIGWVDRVPSLVFPWLFSAYGTFLMRQFFITVPRELEEAAFVDGASRWTILWRVFVPLSLPAIATQVTFSFLYAWNSFVWPFIVISTGNTDAQVLSVALLQFGGRAQDAPQLIFAGVTIAVAVPILAFALVQRYFVENVATSGIK
jgi:multiple sugar transport system permease protein